MAVSEFLEKHGFTEENGWYLYEMPTAFPLYEKHWVTVKESEVERDGMPWLRIEIGSIWNKQGRVQLERGTVSRMEFPLTA